MNGPIDEDEDWWDRLRLDLSPTSLSTGGVVSESDESLDTLDSSSDDGDLFLGLFWGCASTLVLVFIVAVLILGYTA